MEPSRHGYPRVTGAQIILEGPGIVLLRRDMLSSSIVHRNTRGAKT